MFERVVTIPSGCKKAPNAHEPHWWVEGWIWPRTIDCPGISKRAKRKDTDTFGALYPEDHRHFFKLTKIYRSPYGSLGGFHQISDSLTAWQCKCGAFFRKDRIDLYSQMLSWKGVDQTWPS